MPRHPSQPHYERLIEEFSRKHSPTRSPLPCQSNSSLASVEDADIGDSQDTISQIGNVSSSIRSNMTKLKIFDFDSTLFRSPLPNPNLWSPELTGLLISDLGWFTDPRTLGHPGIPLHPDVEWFDEDVVRDARLALQDPGTTLTVLLTGRRRALYGDRVVEICMSLEPSPLPFDIFFFKEPHDMTEQRIRYPNTINFKLNVLSRLLEAFPTIKHVEFWEDRPKHVEIFERELKSMQSDLRINSYDIHFVQQDPELEKYLEQKFEENLVDDLVNKHNSRIDKVAFSPTTGFYSTQSVSVMTLVKPVEMAEVKFTGIKIDRSCKLALSEAFPIPTDKDGKQTFRMVPSLHVTMYRGQVDSDELAWIGGLGAEVSLQVINVGTIPGKIVALQLYIRDKDDECCHGNSGKADTKVVCRNDENVHSSSESLEPKDNFFMNTHSHLKRHVPHTVTSNISSTSTTLSQRQHAINTSSGAAPPSSECNMLILSLYVASGSKSHDAYKITDWQPVPKSVSSLIIKGTAFEKRVIGLARHRSKHAVQHLPNPVSIGGLVMSSYPSLKGREVGLAVRLAQAWMKRDGVENALEQKEVIQRLIYGMKNLVGDRTVLEREVDSAEDTVNGARGRSLQRIV